METNKELRILITELINRIEDEKLLLRIYTFVDRLFIRH